MKRFDENVPEEQEAIYTCFQVVESIMEGTVIIFPSNMNIWLIIWLIYNQNKGSDDPEIATKVGQSSNFLGYLLKRLRGRNINQIKIFAGEILAVILQTSG